MPFAQTDGLRSNLHQFVFGDEFKGCFQGQLAGLFQDYGFVGGGGPDVGHLFCTADIHRDIVVPAVLTDDLPLVDFFARGHKEGMFVEE